MALLDALEIHRLAQLARRNGIPFVPRLLRKFIQITASAYLGTEASFGPDCELAYGGLGIVVHPKSRIGARVRIGPHVTIGGRSNSKGAPIIEDDVQIGAGACLLGDIRIGKAAQIGANAVVIHDVPANTAVVGVPAIPIHHRDTSSTMAMPTKGDGSASVERGRARHIPIHFEDEESAPKSQGRRGPRSGPKGGRDLS
jgi:serine O-acetyltransferase